MNKIYTHNNGKQAFPSKKHEGLWYIPYENGEDVLYTIEGLKSFGYPVEQEKETDDWITKVIDDLLNLGWMLDEINGKNLKTAILKHMPKSLVGENETWINFVNSEADKIAHAYEEAYGHGDEDALRTSIVNKFLYPDVLPTGGASREVDAIWKKLVGFDGSNDLRIENVSYQEFCEAMGEMPTATPEGGNDTSTIDKSYIAERHKKNYTIENRGGSKPFTEDEDRIRNKSINIIYDFLKDHPYLPHTTPSTPTKTHTCNNCGKYMGIEGDKRYCSSCKLYFPMSTPTKAWNVDEIVRRIEEILYENCHYFKKDLKLASIKSILSEYTTPDRNAVVDECIEEIQSTFPLKTVGDTELNKAYELGKEHCCDILKQLKMPLSSDTNSK